MLPTVRHEVLKIPVAIGITTMIVSEEIGIIILMKVLAPGRPIATGLPILQPRVVHGLLTIRQKMLKAVGPTTILINLRVVGTKKILRTLPKLDGMSIILNRA